MPDSSPKFRPAPKRVTLAVRIIYTNSKGSLFRRRGPHTDPKDLVVPADSQQAIREDLIALGIAQPKKEHIYFSSVVDRAVELTWPSLVYPRSARPIEVKLTHGLLEVAPRLEGLSISAVMSYVLRSQAVALHTVMVHDNPCAFIYDPTTTNDLVHKLVRVWGECAHESHPLMGPYPSGQPSLASGTTIPKLGHNTETDMHIHDDSGNPMAASSLHGQHPPNLSPPEPTTSSIPHPLSPEHQPTLICAPNGLILLGTQPTSGLKRKLEAVDSADADDTATKASRISELTNSMHGKVTPQPPQLPTSLPTQGELSISDTWKARVERAERRGQEALDILCGILKDPDGPELDLLSTARALREEVQSLRIQVQDGKTRLKTLQDESAQQMQALNWGNQNSKIASSLTNALLQISAMSASLSADK